MHLKRILAFWVFLSTTSLWAGPINGGGGGILMPNCYFPKNIKICTTVKVSVDFLTRGCFFPGLNLTARVAIGDQAYYIDGYKLQATSRLFKGKKKKFYMEFYGACTFKISVKFKNKALAKYNLGWTFYETSFPGGYSFSSIDFELKY